VTREMIGRDVWKDAGGVVTNTIDVYVTMLRKKVERPGARQLIHTVRGVGYALRDGSWAG
jgi:DNA-binding response OmpR family regulator